MRQSMSRLAGAACLAAALSGCGSSHTQTVTVGTHTAATPFTELIASDKTGVIRIEAHNCEGGDVGTGVLLTPRLVATVDHVVSEASRIELKHESHFVANGLPQCGQNSPPVSDTVAQCGQTRVGVDSRSTSVGASGIGPVSSASDTTSPRFGSALIRPGHYSATRCPTLAVVSGPPRSGPRNTAQCRGCGMRLPSLVRLQ